MITDDMGKTWQEHSSSRGALIEPGRCQASLISYTADNGKQYLLFSNPNDPQVRRKMSVKLSKDLGVTWPEENQLLLYEPNCYGYSCMTVIDGGYIGIIYEGIKELYFEKIHISELLNSQ